MSTVNELNEQQGGVDSVQVQCAGFLLSTNGVLHHLGFVVSSISAAAEDFAVSISARWDGEIIFDPIQRVRVAFFYPADTRNPVFELVEPVGEGSPVSNFLKKKGEDCTMSVMKLTTWSRGCARHAVRVWSSWLNLRPPWLLTDAESPGFVPRSACWWNCSNATGNSGIRKCPVQSRRSRKLS